jgi:hypothetical protein
MGRLEKEVIRQEDDGFDVNHALLDGLLKEALSYFNKLVWRKK